MVDESLPPQIEEQYNKASMAIDKKNYNYAIELLTQVISIKPDFAKGRELLRLVEIKNFQENPPNAIMRSLGRILSLLYGFIAILCEASGKTFAAISIYEKILRKDSKYTAVLVKLGRLLKAEDMKGASLVTLQCAVEITQKDPTAYQLLGELYSELTKYEKANFCFKKVLELRPHDAHAERQLKNIAALSTIDKSFDKKDTKDLRIRDITE